MGRGKTTLQKRSQTGSGQDGIYETSLSHKSSMSDIEKNSQRMEHQDGIPVSMRKSSVAHDQTEQHNEPSLESINIEQSVSSSAHAGSKSSEIPASPSSSTQEVKKRKNRREPTIPLQVSTRRRAKQAEQGGLNGNDGDSALESPITPISVSNITRDEIPRDKTARNEAMNRATSHVTTPTSDTFVEKRPRHIIKFVTKPKDLSRRSPPPDMTMDDAEIEKIINDSIAMVEKAFIPASPPHIEVNQHEAGNEMSLDPTMLSSKTDESDPEITNSALPSPGNSSVPEHENQSSQLSTNGQDADEDTVRRPKYPLNGSNNISKSNPNNPDADVDDDSPGVDAISQNNEGQNDTNSVNTLNFLPSTPGKRKRSRPSRYEPPEQSATKKPRTIASEPADTDLLKPHGLSTRRQNMEPLTVRTDTREPRTRRSSRVDVNSSPMTARPPESSRSLRRMSLLVPEEDKESQDQGPLLRIRVRTAKSYAEPGSDVSDLEAPSPEPSVKPSPMQTREGSAISSGSWATIRSSMEPGMHGPKKRKRRSRQQIAEDNAKAEAIVRATEGRSLGGTVPSALPSSLTSAPTRTQDTAAEPVVAPRVIKKRHRRTKAQIAADNERKAAEQRERDAAGLVNRSLRKSSRTAPEAGRGSVYKMEDNSDDDASMLQRTDSNMDMDTNLDQDDDGGDTPDSRNDATPTTGLDSGIYPRRRGRPPKNRASNGVGGEHLYSTKSNSFPSSNLPPKNYIDPGNWNVKQLMDGRLKLNEHQTAKIREVAQYRLSRAVRYGKLTREQIMKRRNEIRKVFWRRLTKSMRQAGISLAEISIARLEAPGTTYDITGPPERNYKKVCSALSEDLANKLKHNVNLTNLKREMTVARYEGDVKVTNEEFDARTEDIKTSFVRTIEKVCEVVEQEREQALEEALEEQQKRDAELKTQLLQVDQNNFDLLAVAYNVMESRSELDLLAELSLATKDHPEIVNKKIEDQQERVLVEDQVPDSSKSQANAPLSSILHPNEAEESKADIHMQDGKQSLFKGSSNVETEHTDIQASLKTASSERKHARTDSKNSRSSKRMNVADLIQGSIPATASTSRPHVNVQNITNTQSSNDDHNSITRDHNMDVAASDAHRRDVQDRQMSQRTSGHLNSIHDSPTKATSSNMSPGNDVSTTSTAHSRPRSSSKRERIKLTIDSSVSTRSPIVFQNYVAAPNMPPTRTKEVTSRPTSQGNATIDPSGKNNKHRRQKSNSNPLMRLAPRSAQDAIYISSDDSVHEPDLQNSMLNSVPPFTSSVQKGKGKARANSIHQPGTSLVLQSPAPFSSPVMNFHASPDARPSTSISASSKHGQERNGSASTSTVEHHYPSRSSQHKASSDDQPNQTRYHDRRPSTAGADLSSHGSSMRPVNLELPLRRPSISGSAAQPGFVLSGPAPPPDAMAQTRPVSYYPYRPEAPSPISPGTMAPYDSRIRSEHSSHYHGSYESGTNSSSLPQYHQPPHAQPQGSPPQSQHGWPPRQSPRGETLPPPHGYYLPSREGPPLQDMILVPVDQPPAPRRKKRASVPQHVSEMRFDPAVGGFVDSNGVIVADFPHRRTTTYIPRNYVPPYPPYYGPSTPTFRQPYSYSNSGYPSYPGNVLDMPPERRASSFGVGPHPPPAPLAPVPPASSVLQPQPQSQPQHAPISFRHSSLSIDPRGGLLPSAEREIGRFQQTLDFRASHLPVEGESIMSRRHDEPLHRRPSIQTSPIVPRPSSISRITQDAGRRPSSSTLYDVINRPDRNEGGPDISSHPPIESSRDPVRISDPRPPSRDHGVVFSPPIATTFAHCIPASIREATTAVPTATPEVDQSKDVPPSSIDAEEPNRDPPNHSIDVGPIAPQAPSMRHREPSQTTEAALAERPT